MDTLTDIFMGAAHIALALAPHGLGSAAVLLTWGLMLHAPLIAATALLIRLTK